MTLDALRTPDERFSDLSGFDFEPHYVDVDGLRIHHVDEGSGPVVLLLHGEPTWSYLYRKMIPVLVEAGLRAVAPDLVGFGRSDKPARRADYTYARHVAWMSGFLDAAGLSDITVFGQDWGGLIGLRLVAERPDLFARVVASNTGLPTGEEGMGEAFERWREFSQTVPEMPIGVIVSGGCATAKLTPDEIAAYDAPFPDETYKEGARQFPVLVPATADDPAACRPEARVGSARAFRETVPLCLRRQRPDHGRRRRTDAREHPRRQGTTTHDHRGGRALHPGRQAGRDRARHHRLRQGHVSVTIVFETHSTSTDNERGVASGWLDPSLSEKGREQAAELGSRRTDVDAVYTSDLKRAIETAEIAFGSGGFRTDARLRESDYGSMSGAPPAKIERDRPDRIDTPFPDGESFQDVIERVRSFLDDVSRDHEGERVLVIGHMATRVELDHLLAGVPLEEAVGGQAWQPGWEYST